MKQKILYFILAIAINLFSIYAIFICIAPMRTDADSVKGDTIWKDGISIVNKNIVNVSFK